MRRRAWGESPTQYDSFYHTVPRHTSPIGRCSKGVDVLSSRSVSGVQYPKAIEWHHDPSSSALSPLSRHGYCPPGPSSCSLMRARGLEREIILHMASKE